MTLQHIIPYLFPTFIWILTIAITLRLLMKKQSVTAMLAWLMVIYIFPLFGILIYLIFGEINLGEKRNRKFNQVKKRFIEWYRNLSKQDNLTQTPSAPRFKPLFDLVQQRLNIPCVIGNELHIFNTPESIIHKVLEDIHHAKTEINMVFYIWQSGGLIDEIETALIDAVKRGVKVRILIDSVGGRQFLKSSRSKALKAQGLEIVECLSVSLFRMFFSRIDLRMHRKIIAIDNQISYTGSMNMVDPKFFKQDADVGEWVDVMVRIEGPVSSVLNSLHIIDWQIETGEALDLITPSECSLSQDPDNSHMVQVLAIGPGLPADLMEQSLCQAIFDARKSITITSPYFVPSQKIAEALAVVAYRGVEVNIILPAKNDSRMVEYASRTFFDDLLKAGVKIYNFDAGLLHTKSLLIDDRLSMIGTVNMDLRSFLLNFELMLLIEDKSFAQELYSVQQSYIANSELMDYQRFNQRSQFKRVIEKLYFLFSPLL